MEGKLYLKNINRIFILMAILSVIISGACSKQGNSPGNIEKQSPDGSIQPLLSRETLESVGFEHFGAYDFRLLFDCGHLYVLNSRDYMIVKFLGKEPQAVFKTTKGQAPTEMIHPITIFRYNTDTIAVFDKSKRSVLRFDRHLNYIDEVSLEKDYNYIYDSDNGLLAFLDYKNDDACAFLDENFRPVEAFVKANKTIPFERFYPQLLNKCFILDRRSVAHTYGLYPRKNCSVAVYRLNDKTAAATLTWKQPFSPTQKDISARKKLYFSLYVGKHGPYYVVQSTIVKALGRKEKYHSLVFSQDGELVHDEIFPHRFVSVQKDSGNSNVYFLDDDENISYIDITKMVAQPN
jgi:hypothetical protein